MPLIRGHYPQTNPLFALLGATTNIVNPAIPARSNLEWGISGNPSDGALASTGVGCFVPIPVEPGTVVSKVSFFVGGTAGGTLTHQFAAIYSGIATPALIAQSTDATSGAVAASGKFDFTLTTAAQISVAQAPYGFIYAEIMFAASQIPTALSVAIPTAVGYQYYTNGPLFLSGTAGSSLTATAAATIATPSAKAVAPIVVLS